MRKDITPNEMRAKEGFCADPVTGKSTSTGEDTDLGLLTEDWTGSVLDLLEMKNLDVFHSAYMSSWFDWLTEEERSLIACYLSEAIGVSDLYSELCQTYINKGKVDLPEYDKENTSRLEAALYRVLAGASHTSAVAGYRRVIHEALEDLEKEDIRTIMIKALTS